MLWKAYRATLSFQNLTSDMGTTTYEFRSKTNTKQRSRPAMEPTYHKSCTLAFAMPHLSSKGSSNEISMNSWKSTKEERMEEKGNTWMTSGWHQLELKKGYPCTEK
jgi:hypothetical protein